MIAAVSLVVREYDEAIAFFTGALGFALVEDTPMGNGKRWVRVAPPGGGVCLLLARAATPAQAERVGDQTGGRVFLFLHTDDFWRDHRRMTANGVRFVEGPREEAYGRRLPRPVRQPLGPGATAGNARIDPTPAPLRIFSTHVTDVGELGCTSRSSARNCTAT